MTFFVPILQNYEFIVYGFSLLQILALILIGAISEQSIDNKMVSKIWVGMSDTDIDLYTNSEFVVIYKNANFECW